MIIKKTTKSPWIISISTAIFSLFLTIGYDYFKKNPFFTTIGTIFNWAWRTLINALNFELKIWWILMAIAFFVGIIYLIKKSKGEEPVLPDFHTYREGKLKKWKWTWDWKWSTSGDGWIITDMEAHCPNCDTPMIDNSSMYGFSFDCPRCEFHASDSQCDEPRKIERIIHDNIDRMRKENSVP
ncbi:MAG: hypothetical protein P4L28_00350 [Paludibacteraceae bacterium]|nr:hypothetical protein [Paludibacteraceae bacterium]